MKRLFTAVAAVAILASAFPTIASAEDYHRDHRNEREWHHERERERIHHERAREFRREVRWERGHALPYEYRREVIGNYGSYHLRRPPRGYHWVRANGDFLLVAIASGVIADVILH